MPRNMSFAMTAEQLLPCPFCGKTNHLIPGDHGVYCMACFTTGPDGNGIKCSVEFWNKRFINAEQLIAVCYSGCKFEETPVPVSLHKTHKGAVRAMTKLKKEKLSDKSLWPDMISFQYRIYKTQD